MYARNEKLSKKMKEIEMMKHQIMGVAVAPMEPPTFPTKRGNT
jgi:hypothetical protein